MLSKAQIDRLGERLRRQDYGEADLELLDEYRRAFGPAYDRVVEKIEPLMGVPVSGRPAKSTTSIIEKLNRESIRLSQMQDIAGCRVVVGDGLEQDQKVDAVKAAFEDVVIFDRREKPSHGYRAVHLVIRKDGNPIEVQIRTQLQQVWAELSEKLADLIDPAIKYGGGPLPIRALLDRVTQVIRDIEDGERKIARAGLFSSALAQELRSMREEYVATMHSLIGQLDGADLKDLS